MRSGPPPLIVAGREETLVAPRNRLCRGRVVESSGKGYSLLLLRICGCWVTVGGESCRYQWLCEESGNHDTLCSGPASAVAAMLAGRVEMRLVAVSWWLGKLSECVSIRFSVGSYGLGGVGRPRTITGAAANIITGSPVILGPVIRNTR